MILTQVMPGTADFFHVFLQIRILRTLEVQNALGLAGLLLQHRLALKGLQRLQQHIIHHNRTHHQADPGQDHNPAARDCLVINAGKEQCHNSCQGRSHPDDPPEL